MIIEEDICKILEDLLHYSKLINDFELEDWVKKELNGYTQFDKTPSYRKNIIASWKEQMKIVDSQNVSIRLGAYDIRNFIEKQNEYIIRNSFYNFLGLVIIFFKDFFKIDRLAFITIGIFFIFTDKDKMDSINLKLFLYLALFLHFIISYKKFYELELKVEIDELIKLERKIRNEAMNKLEAINKTNLSDVNIPKFNRFLNDEVFIEVLKSRWNEANLCNTYGLYLSSLTLIGSIFEGSLYALCQENFKLVNQSIASPKDKNGNVKKIKNWTFEELINVAINLKWIKSDISELSRHIKEYRNFIHVKLQIEKSVEFRESQVNISIAILHSVLKDFESIRTDAQSELEKLTY